MMARPKGSTVARLPINTEKFEDLLMYCDQYVNRPSVHEKLIKMFYILHHTGLRASELLLLNISMMRAGMKEGRFSLTNETKTKSTRLVLISKKGQEDLKELFDMEIDDSLPGSQKIFLRHDGKQLKKEGIIRLLNIHIKEALGKLYSSHSFRQAYVTDLLKIANPSSVAKMVGHRSIQTTLRYSYASQEELEDLLERVR
jgi:integrase